MNRIACVCWGVHECQPVLVMLFRVVVNRILSHFTSTLRSLPPSLSLSLSLSLSQGIDSETDYTYTSPPASPCWTEAALRDVATIDGYKTVPPSSESQLAAALLLNPVSVLIEADQTAFQSYKSGVFDAPCGK